MIICIKVRFWLWLWSHNSMYQLQSITITMTHCMTCWFIIKIHFKVMTTQFFQKVDLQACTWHTLKWVIKFDVLLLLMETSLLQFLHTALNIPGKVSFLIGIKWLKTSEHVARTEYREISRIQRKSVIYFVQLAGTLYMHAISDA